eukprot:CAMPEP_0174240134 /NCGR_PEP_ID=MMETSP0417-20130205/17584_1 /TAXON_ID=242541 /ORGANISM="Mayorella sp, Strain BSH-02190019" /LENGTH=157 /DNA_ID=CAMNT_0015319171 /DNA_START=83 /DNA_END=552 /DNA_ORIENTATION=-
MSLPTVLRSEIQYKSFVKIREDVLRLEDGSEYKYYVHQTRARVAMVLAFTDTGRVLVNQEYRHPTGKILLGCPGGMVEKGESFLEGAERELREETGYTEGEFVELGVAYPLPGLSTLSFHYILATGLKRTVTPECEPSEVIQAREFELSELRSVIAG